MEWINIKTEFPMEIKTRGHGLCNILVVYPYAGIPRVEQCLLIGNKIKTFKDRDVTNIVTHWMYLPTPPN